MTQIKIIDYFQKILPMPLEMAEQFAMAFEQKRVLKNEVLLPENKINSITHFIEDGYIRSFVLNADGDQVTTCIYGTSSFADNFLSFFKRTPSQETYQALTDCELWTLSYDTVQRYFHTVPEFREWGRLLLLQQYNNLQSHTLDLVRLTAEQRYEKLMIEHPDYFQNIPLKILSSFIGITDTSMSRIRKEYKNNGIA